MTVAAVILFVSVEDALTEAGGRPAVRRTVEAAWAGGATPIVVISPDENGQVAAALAGSPAVLAEPAPLEAESMGQIVRGMGIAAERVTDTEAALVWPGRMVWVDPETVTSLIEAHGVTRDLVLRPAYRDELGWPVLVPLALRPALAGLPVEGKPDELIDALATDGSRFIETGDPGVVHDRTTAIEALPSFEGPPEPVAGPPPEWGAAAADSPDDSPLEGPALAPYGEAADER